MQRAFAVMGAVLLVVSMWALPSFAQFAGFLHAESKFEFDDPWPEAFKIDLEAGVEYSVGDWSFGTRFDAKEDGLEDLAFLATGTLGSFHVYSMYGQWDLDDDVWTDWDNAVWINAFGTEFWYLFSLQTEGGDPFILSGAGSAFGGHGTVGDVEVWWEASFNLWELVPWIYWNGLETVIDQNLACDLIAVGDPTCAMDFSYAEVFVQFPFCCLDVTSWIGFDCEGFDGFELWVKDIPVGNTGVRIDWIDLWYDLDEKDLDLWFGIDVGDVVCFTPYLSLEDNPDDSIAGVHVDALGLVCTLGDVTITVSELLSDDAWYIGTDGAIHSYDDGFAWIIPSDCIDIAYDVEEAIAIEINRGACCGDGSTLGLYSFFDTDLDDTLFSWLGLRVRAETSLSPSLSTYMEMWMWYDGLESVSFGVDVTWGTLQSLPKDLTCCLAPF
jgi:hypothetical protein